MHSSGRCHQVVHYVGMGRRIVVDEPKEKIKQAKNNLNIYMPRILESAQKIVIKSISRSNNLSGHQHETCVACLSIFCSMETSAPIISQFGNEISV